MTLTGVSILVWGGSVGPMGPYLQHARWRQGEEDTRALPMRVTSGSVERPQGA